MSGHTNETYAFDINRAFVIYPTWCAFYTCQTLLSAWAYNEFELCNKLDVKIFKFI